MQSGQLVSKFWRRDLSLGLALGDFEAMVLRGRPAIRVHLAGAPGQALEELGSLTAKALELTRRTK
jgi:hypothetical protein